MGESALPLDAAIVEGLYILSIQLILIQNAMIAAVEEWE